MQHLMLWLSVHRFWLMGLVAFSTWAAANYWYWRGDFKRMRRENRAHSWSVDMAAKTGKGGRKNIR